MAKADLGLLEPIALVVKDLYDSAEGQEVLLLEQLDVSRAAARLLGKDVRLTVGARRLDELLERWPGDRALLARELAAPTAPSRPTDRERRSALIDALTRGLEPD